MTADGGSDADAGIGQPNDDGSDQGATPPTPDDGLDDGGDEGSVELGGPARSLALRLGREPNFLFGVGADLDGPYELGVPLDLNYVYLVRLAGEPGAWTEWNPDGSYVDKVVDKARAAGMLPMFTLYAMAARGDGNLDILSSTSDMTAYWRGVRLLFDRLGALDTEAIVHLEPDFWGYTQRASSGDPHALPVIVTRLVPECGDLTDDVAGLGRCIVRLGRTLAPKVAIAFPAITWAAPDPEGVAAYLMEIGADEADLVTVETLDRDAGCFEARVDPACQRRDGPWYWDETNTTSPNFAEHFAWARRIHEGTGKPLLWWQVPLGVPGSSPGTDLRYRDNRVRYFFGHVQELIDAGGIGAAFGAGAVGQTTLATDGGQFREAAERYYAAPLPLP